MNVPASVAALEAFPIMEKALVFLFVFVQVSCEIVNQISVVKKRHFEITHIFDPPKCFLKAFRHDYYPNFLSTEGRFPEEKLLLF